MPYASVNWPAATLSRREPPVAKDRGSLRAPRYWFSLYCSPEKTPCRSATMWPEARHDQDQRLLVELFPADFRRPHEYRGFSRPLPRAGHRGRQPARSQSSRLEYGVFEKDPARLPRSRPFDFDVQRDNEFRQSRRLGPRRVRKGARGDPCGEVLGSANPPGVRGEPEK